MLKLVASRSTCRRRQVGAIITDVRGHVLSMGYNGVPSRLPHCVEIPCLGTEDPPGDSSRCLAVHAEQNAILQCRSLENAHTMYVSCAPCFTCSKLISNTPITTVVVTEMYADSLGLGVLRQRGIKFACTVSEPERCFFDGNLRPCPHHDPPPGLNDPF